MVRPDVELLPAHVTVEIEEQGDMLLIKEIKPEKVKIKHEAQEVIWDFKGLPPGCWIMIENGSHGPVDDCDPLKKKPFKKSLVSKPGHSELSSGFTDDGSVGDPKPRWRKSWSYEIKPVSAKGGGIGLDPWVIVEKP